MRPQVWSLPILLAALLSGGAVKPEDSDLLGDPASTRAIQPIDPASAPGDGPVIDSFEAVPDCILPDPHRRILSYHVSNWITRVRIDAVHRGGRIRTFHTAASRAGDPTMAAIGVQDPRASNDIEAYLLVVTGVRGLEARRRLPFRYRLAEFELIPPTGHAYDNVEPHRYYTIYDSNAHFAHVESLTCSFRFDAPIAGEAGRAGGARLIHPGPSDGQMVVCGIDWRNRRKAHAGGTVEWTARFTDPCTQGRVTRTARVNAIP
jgi:hypothetical protein